MDNIKLWLYELTNCSLPSWDNLPEVDLYMDQIISFLEKKLEPFAIGEDKLVTSFMINNYVKGEVISSPNQKKYSREQVGALFVICLLKQVVSLKDISLILKVNQNVSHTNKCIYDYFKDMYEKTLQSVVNEVSNEMEDIKNDTDLINLAVLLSIKSQIYKMISTKILLDEHNRVTKVESSQKEKPTKKETKSEKKIIKKEKKAQKRAQKKEKKK